jgi:hypothetical protein
MKKQTFRQQAEEAIANCKTVTAYGGGEHGALYRLVKEGILRTLPLLFRERYYAVEGRDATECYIQVRGYSGNAMCWWRKGGAGYTYDIREAEMFPLEEAEKIVRSNETGKFTTHLCSDIERNVKAQKLIIDCQYIDA